MKLEIQDLSKSYAKLHALSNLTVDIPSFNVLTLIGPSGSGKSTLIKLIAGLDVPDHGTINLDGVTIPTDESLLLEYRRPLGVIFQAWNLFPHLTAEQNITLSLHHVHGYSSEESRVIAYELLQRFSMQAHAHKKPFELSGGQCQRVAIIRAIAARPKLILLDEPTSALDPIMTSEVFELIVELKNQGTALILSTHHLAFAEKISDWSIFLSNGKLIASQPSAEMSRSQGNPYIQNYLHKMPL